MWIITSFEYFTEFSLYRQFYECAKIISDCVYRQVCCCCCDYIPVCTCCCDYILVCTCFTAMLMRSAMTKAARTMYAMTTLTTEILTTERLHCLRPSRSFRLDNAAWRAAYNAGVTLHQPTRRGCRGGARLHRSIHTIVSTRPTPSAKPPCVNGANLVNVMLKNCEVKSNTHLALINARSIRNKATIINEHIVEHKWDVLAITETWLSKNGDDATIAEVTPPGYTFRHVARSSGCGGGVAIVHRNTYKTKLQPKLSFTTMNLLRLQIINPHCVKYNVWVVYHAPVSSKSSGLISEFYVELEHLFTEAAISVVPTIIAFQCTRRQRS